MGKNLLTVKPMGTKILKNKDIGFEVLKKKKKGYHWVNYHKLKLSAAFHKYIYFISLNYK